MYWRAPPQAFAGAGVSLYSEADTWESLSQNGLECVRQKFSLERFEQNLEKLAANMGVNPQPDVKKVSAAAKIGI